MKRCPVVLSRMERLCFPHQVDHHLLPQVAISMHMDLIIVIPIHHELFFKQVEGRHPFALMAIGIAVFHLHQLGIYGPVGE